MNYQDKNQRFQTLMTQIITIAEEDGKISESEAEIIKKLKFSIEMFNEGVEKALEDNIITDAESLVLRNIEQNMLQNVFELIERDDKLDGDGKRLVEMVFDVMMNTLK